MIRASVLTSAAAAAVHLPSAMGQSTAQSSEEEQQRNKRAKIVAERHFINQTSVIPQTPIFTPSADGLFRASVYLETDNNDPNTFIRLSLTWTDDYEFRSSNVTPPEGAALQIQGGNTQGDLGTVIMRMKSGTPFSVQTSVPDVGGTIAAPYNVYVVIETL